MDGSHRLTIPTIIASSSTFSMSSSSVVLSVVSSLRLPWLRRECRCRTLNPTWMWYFVLRKACVVNRHHSLEFSANLLHGILKKPFSKICRRARVNSIADGICSALTTIPLLSCLFRTCLGAIGAVTLKGGWDCSVCLFPNEEVSQLLSVEVPSAHWSLILSFHSNGGVSAPDREGIP